MYNKIKVEDAYHPLGCADYIDITVSFGGRFFNGLLEVKNNEVEQNESRNVKEKRVK